MHRPLYAVCFSLLLSSPAFSSSSGVPGCSTYPEACIFELAIKETTTTDPNFIKSVLPSLAFHSGRLGWGNIPGNLIIFLPEHQRAKASSFLSAGWSVHDGTASIRYHQPIDDLEEMFIAERSLADRIWNLAQNQILDILRASSLQSNVQGKVLAQILAKDLDRGEYRLVEGRYPFFSRYLGELQYPLIGLKELTVTLAIKGYPEAARKIVEDFDAPINQRKQSSLIELIDVIELYSEGSLDRTITAIAEMPSAASRAEALSYLTSFGASHEDLRVIVALFEDEFIGLPEKMRSGILLKTLSRIAL